MVAIRKGDHELPSLLRDLRKKSPTGEGRLTGEGEDQNQKEEDFMHGSLARTSAWPGAGKGHREPPRSTAGACGRKEFPTRARESNFGSQWSLPSERWLYLMSQAPADFPWGR